MQQMVPHSILLWGFQRHQWTLMGNCNASNIKETTLKNTLCMHYV